MENAQRGRVLPLDKSPAEQRVVGFGVTNESRVFPAVISFPLRQLLLAFAITHGPDELGSYVLGSAIAQGIEGNRIRDAGERITVVGARQHRALIVQPV